MHWADLRAVLAFAPTRSTHVSPALGILSCSQVQGDRVIRYTKHRLSLVIFIDFKVVIFDHGQTFAWQTQEKNV